MESLIHATKNPPLPDVWVFDLTPSGDHPRPLNERVKAALEYASRRGLKVARLRIALEPQPAAVPDAVRVRW